MERIVAPVEELLHRGQEQAQPAEPTDFPMKSEVMFVGGSLELDRMIAPTGMVQARARARCHLHGAEGIAD